MSFELKPRTPAGQRFVAAAEGLIPVLRKRAERADRDARVCAENFRDLAESGISGAFVPEALGGMGLASVHDWSAGIAALARGDGSTAIAINMHLGVSRGLAAAYHASERAGNAGDAIRGPLQAIASGEMLICATATEAGTDNLHPFTEAVADEVGYRINGHKLFVTMSPVATHLGMNLRMRDGDGDHLVTTLLPIDTPGVVPQDDWDSLGMRGSGSQSVRFDDVLVPKRSVRPLGPWGRWSPQVVMNRTLGNLSLVGAFLGMAEHASELALSAVAKQQRVDQPVKLNSGVQHLVGEMEIQLASCRSILASAGDAADRLLHELGGQTPDLASAHELLKDYQSAKWIVNRGAIDIVSKAMDLVGGSAFMSAHPLSRLYRDVRAGPFMQPFGPTEIRQYVGRVALGLYPES